MLSPQEQEAEIERLKIKYNSVCEMLTSLKTAIADKKTTELSAFWQMSGAFDGTQEHVHDYYWNYSVDGELMGEEFDTKELAQQDADENFSQMMEDNGDRSGNQEIVLVKCYDDEETGDHIEICREESSCEHNLYHGDAEEHWILHSGGGGVL